MEPDIEHNDTDDTKAREQETQKSYRTILAQEIEEGLDEINRPTSGQFLSGLSAGLDIGFGPLLVTILLTMPRDGLPEPLFELLLASAYAVGFIFVVQGRSVLFTEQTTLAVLPVLHGRATYGELAKVWATVYTANIVGGAAFAGIAVVTGPAMGIVSQETFAELARSFVSYSWQVTLISAVLAGWLMGLLSWLVQASRDTVSIIFLVWIIASTIGFAHLPHSIAGNVEVLFGVFTGHVGVAPFVTFLAFTTLGNAVGGVVFVALIKHSHASRGGDKPEAVQVPSGDER
jgi:formate/nitrite transporter FocA (FNT family)